MEKWEDRENDWLAREMAREGYRNNRSSLEEDHAREERSHGWNAGAISNAREHEVRHQRAVQIQQVRKAQPVSRGARSFVQFIVYFMLIIYFLVFIFAIIS